MFHKTKTKSDQVDKLENIKKVEPQDLNIDRFSHDQENILLVWAKKFGLLVFEIVKVVLISLAIILPVRMFLIQPFYVEGASMEPNFYDKEYLIIDEISYRFDYNPCGLDFIQKREQLQHPNEDDELKPLYN